MIRMQASVAMAYPVDGEKMMEAVEAAGRTCYKSEDRITPGSAEKFVRQIIKSGHESVLEHEKVSVRVVCDRGVSHEIVRHRLASYSQESTRYCDYKGGMAVIEMGGLLAPEAEAVWLEAMDAAEKAYARMRAMGVSPQLARSVLPNSLKTEIVMTMNLREWRHFFRLRTAKAAHPQMREVAGMAFELLKGVLPVVFEDIEVPN